MEWVSIFEGFRPALSQDTDASVNQKIWDFLLSGGIFMGFIAACSFVALSVSIHRIISLRWASILPPALVGQLERAERIFRQGKAVELFRALDESEPSAKLRAHMQGLLAEARKLVGMVEMRVDVSGAALTVDGEPPPVDAGAEPWVLGVGYGAAGLALVGGIVFTAVANGKASDAEAEAGARISVTPRMVRRRVVRVFIVLSPFVS